MPPAPMIPIFMMARPRPLPWPCYRAACSGAAAPSSGWCRHCPCAREHLSESWDGCSARPVALQLRTKDRPSDWYAASRYHALDRHLVRFDAHAARCVGDDIDLVAFASRLDRRHGEADLGPQCGHHDLLASGLLDPLDDALVLPGVDESAVDRLLLREDILQLLEQAAALVFHHRA